MLYRLYQFVFINDSIKLEPIMLSKVKIFNISKWCVFISVDLTISTDRHHFTIAFYEILLCLKQWNQTEKKNCAFHGRHENLICLDLLLISWLSELQLTYDHLFLLLIYLLFYFKEKISPMLTLSHVTFSLNISTFTCSIQILIIISLIIVMASNLFITHANYFTFLH